MKVDTVPIALAALLIPLVPLRRTTACTVPVAARLTLRRKRQQWPLFHEEF